ncbi:MAG: hypothetical protein IT557_03590 [Alphaproteobacteria bacterium]|nr:hypothetical protein [Alphaproteobacteria bacterium]
MAPVAATPPARVAATPPPAATPAAETGLPPIIPPPQQVTTTQQRSRAEGGTAVSLQMVGQGPAIIVPARSNVGAAAFRRGDSVWLVFDQPIRLDISAFAPYPALHTAETVWTPVGTALRLPAAVVRSLVLRRTSEAWMVELAAAAAPEENPIGADIADDVDGARILLRATQAGGVVPVHDPDTGATILVGTVRTSGQPIVAARRFAEFALLPTTLGVAVEPQADNILLRPSAEGFTLTAGLRRRGGLQVGGPVAADALAEAARLTRLLYLPTLDTAALVARSRQIMATLGNTAPLARGQPRIELAETLLAQGLGVEAASVVALAMGDDPRLATDARAMALASMAALLAGRLEEAERWLADERIGASDEVTLLRGLLAGARGEGPERLDGFVAALPILFAYPEAVRHRLGAIAADGLLAIGEHGAAGRLVQRLGELQASVPGAALIAFSRARIAEAQGDTQAAREGYAVLMAGRDRLARQRAALAAVELDLRERRIGAPEAVARLEPLLHAWRGDTHELRLRLRLAELRRDAGDVRGALALWRGTMEQFPADAAALAIPEAMRAAYARLFQGAAADAMPASQLIALFDENMDLLPGGPEGSAIVRKVAERAAAAELAARAANLLRDRIAALSAGEEKGRLGLVLAEMRLADGDAAGARAALLASEAQELPAALRHDRRLADARAVASEGNPAAALAMIEGLSDAKALQLRADLAWESRDWPAAQAAQTALLAALIRPGLVPAQGLDQAQRVAVVRLAAAAALTGDAATLAALRRDFATALGQGALSEPFRLLTADPVAGVADLPRIAAELDLARRFVAPDRSASVGAATQPAGSAAPRN